MMVVRVGEWKAHHLRWSQVAGNLVCCIYVLCLASGDLCLGRASGATVRREVQPV